MMIPGTLKIGFRFLYFWRFEIKSKLVLVSEVSWIRIARIFQLTHEQGEYIRDGQVG